MTKRTARLMGKLAALRVDRGIEKSAIEPVTMGILLTLLAEGGIYGGKKLYDWFTAPKAQQGLSDKAKQILQSKDYNIDPRWIDPVKMPEGFTDEDKRLMAVHNITPQTMALHKRFMMMKTEREAAAKKKQEATTADAAKPVSLSDYFKSRPQISQLISQLPDTRAYRQAAAPSRARRAPNAPPWARERGGMAFPTREHEAGFWKKQTQGTPGRVGAERDVMRTGNTNRLRTDQYISRVNELFGQGGALA